MGMKGVRRTRAHSAAFEARNGRLSTNHLLIGVLCAPQNHASLFLRRCSGPRARFFDIFCPGGGGMARNTYFTANRCMYMLKRQFTRSPSALWPFGLHWMAVVRIVVAQSPNAFALMGHTRQAIAADSHFTQYLDMPDRIVSQMGHLNIFHLLLVFVCQHNIH